MGRPRTVLLALALTLAVPPGAAAAVELAGTWYVLIHYKDAATNNPDAERWEDRIWVFEPKGDRLEWTEYPIVVFGDESNRFENLGTNRASRILRHWEPDEAQRAEIREGLQINSRGSHTETLRGSDAAGWSSGSAGGGYRSARFITFDATWSVEDVEGTPVFTQRDVMGSAASEDFEGRTEYTTQAVEEGGSVLRGSFDRDGSRVGTFRMVRSGEASAVRGSGKSQGERVYEMFFGELGAQLYRGEMPGGASEEAMREAVESGAFTEEDRRALRLGFEETLTEGYRAQGNDPAAFRPQIQSLARKMTDLFVDEGKSIEEIQRMLRSGELRP